MPEMHAQDPAPAPSLAPRNWAGWLAVAILWFLGHLPRPVGRALVWPLGPLMRWTLTSRRRIAERNLQACFPEWSDTQRAGVLKESFHSLARMLAEVAWCWAGPRQNLEAITDLRGVRHLEAAVADGRGVLVVTAHVTCLELGARILGARFDGCGIYRPLGNEVLEWYQNRARRFYAVDMISKRHMRDAIRYLRGGGVLWYAPDQDFGPAQSAFAPFFGVQTATLLATHRLPLMTGCQVLTMMPRYCRDSGRYAVEISPVMKNFPGPEPAADLARVNAMLEQQVRKAPGQYWWIHRRFKTRPPGEPDFYGRDQRLTGPA